MPVSVGSPFNNCANASNPPAEAPTPATRKFRTASLPGRLRAGFASAARRFGTARSVLRDIVEGVIQGEQRGEVRRGIRAKSQQGNRRVNSNQCRRNVRGGENHLHSPQTECRESGVRFRLSSVLPLYNSFLSWSQAVCAGRILLFPPTESCPGWRLPRSKGRTLSGKTTKL